jgi:Response regulator of the LytR/AlgR family
MNEIRCMIVDDEPIARDILGQHIAATPGLQLVKSCMNVSEAYEGLHEHHIDMMFLDIQMPVITGTDFLRSLRHPPLVIFTTAYHNHAVEAFELNSVDYLLKPITYERFLQAIQKVRERKNHPPAQAPVDYIFIKQDSRLVRINFTEIIYIEAEKDFSMVFTPGKKWLAGMHLKMFENMLPGHLFYRVHRSYIVQLAKITAVHGNRVELGQTQIPIGANYKTALMNKLGIV